MILMSGEVDLTSWAVTVVLCQAATCSRSPSPAICRATPRHPPVRHLPAAVRLSVPASDPGRIGRADELARKGCGDDVDDVIDAVTIKAAMVPSVPQPLDASITPVSTAGEGVPAPAVAGKADAANGLSAFDRIVMRSFGMLDDAASGPAAQPQDSSDEQSQLQLQPCNPMRPMKARPKQRRPTRNWKPRTSTAR